MLPSRLPTAAGSKGEWISLPRSAEITLADPRLDRFAASGSEDVGKPDLTIDNLLEEWAPRSPRLEELPDPNGPAESYLPRAPLSDGSTATSTTRSAVYRPTSKPYNLPLNPNQESMRYSLSGLLSRPRFASFLSTPLGFSQFRSFLAQHAQPHVVSQLDLWKELDVLKNLHSQSSYAAKGISTAFENEIAGEGEETDLPRQVSHELVRHLQTIASGASSGLLEGPSKHLLDSLYATQFEVSCDLSRSNLFHSDIRPA